MPTLISFEDFTEIRRWFGAGKRGGGYLQSEKKYALVILGVGITRGKGMGGGGGGVIV